MVMEVSRSIRRAAAGRRRTYPHALHTHWHPEHTGSNLAVSRPGTILAHENTRLWLSTDITRPWEAKTFPPMPKEARPNRTFYTTGSLNVNGEQIDYGYMLQAHTDGDIYVFFPKSNVLALGGLTCVNSWPLIDWWTGGWIGGLPDGLDTAVKVANPETRIVTADGPVMTYAQLQAQVQMYRTISQRVQQMMRRGRGVEETLASAPTKEFDATMGNSEQFVRRAFESCWAHLTPDA
jgi:glyoxylase-like metal-dependent hydrolase (beta-lactamase superfamily II)